MEQFRPASGQEGNRSVLIGNMMQLQLAQRHGETIKDFIEKHAAQFRDVLDSHPEYIESFDRDAEETLKHIETVLYH